MSAVIQVVQAEMYKFFRSKSWFSSLLIMALVSVFMLLAAPSEDWRASLESANQGLEQQLGMSAAQISQSPANHIYIEQWKENRAYLDNNIIPANDYSFGTAAGYMSSVLSLRALGLILVVFPVIYAVSMAKEFESGTIQFLVMNPFRRSQILIGKYISTLASSCLFLLITWLTNAAFSMLFKPFGNPFIYSFADGQLIEKSTAVFMLGNSLLSLVYYIPYMTLAFMLATVFRSTTLSLSITLVISLLGTQLIGLLNVRTGMVKFLLPAIVELTHSQNRATIAEINQFPLVQCLLIITCYVAAFLGLAGYSFHKRDIA
ncbi:ABC transporter permease subunit [Paenibacillus sp. MMS20-IR301]|uniref:ABC transporter permease n=1 Tax=Paenibacillus sp. MMS20-IR301 TaxID=2895946 RepID=UPI0028EA45E7|nr:ABC transporter permease subunit [Paenibacillus sp. MMS20-IR301]WNS40730.1 ABC transporter permease subunit [Paenibacillus sp. MMS20-IR301]